MKRDVMTERKSPTWWSTDMDSAWERTKAAFHRDWEQTKHDFGKDDAPDLDQDVDDTLKQAAGKQRIPPPSQPNFDDLEPGFRFGFGAARKYRTEYPKWSDDLESRLSNDWGDEDWKRYRRAVRYGYEYPV